MDNDGTGEDGRRLIDPVYMPSNGGGFRFLGAVDRYGVHELADIYNHWIQRQAANLEVLVLNGYGTSEGTVWLNDDELPTPRGLPSSGFTKPKTAKSVGKYNKKGRGNLGSGLATLTARSIARADSSFLPPLPASIVASENLESDEPIAFRDLHYVVPETVEAEVRELKRMKAQNLNMSTGSAITIPQ